MKKTVLIAMFGLLGYTANATLFTDNFSRTDTALSTNAAVSIGNGYVLCQRDGDKLAEAQISGQQVRFNQTSGSVNASDMILYQSGVTLQNSGPGQSFTVSADITTRSGVAQSWLYGVAFNVQIDGSFYDARINTGNLSVLQLNRRAAGGTVTGITGSGTTSSATNSVLLATSSVYHLTISSSSPGVISYSMTGANLDGGELSGTMIDPTLKLSGGYAGFYISQVDTSVSMDNLSIQTVPEPASTSLMVISGMTILLLRKLHR